MVTYIYILICPITNKVRYVGKSKNPKRRYKQHLKDVGDETYKKKWLSNLKKANKVPYMEIVAELKTDEEARKMENKTVEKYIKTVYNLFMPNKNAPTVHDYRISNNIKFDCEFEKMEQNTDKYNKL